MDTNTLLIKIEIEMPERLVAAYLSYIIWATLLLTYGWIASGLITQQQEAINQTKAKLIANKISTIIDLLDVNCQKITVYIGISKHEYVTLDGQKLTVHFNNVIVKMQISKSVKKASIKSPGFYEFSLHPSYVKVRKIGE